MPRNFVAISDNPTYSVGVVYNLVISSLCFSGLLLFISFFTCGPIPMASSMSGPLLPPRSLSVATTFLTSGVSVPASVLSARVVSVRSLSLAFVASVTLDVSHIHQLYLI